MPGQGITVNAASTPIAYPNLNLYAKWGYKITWSITGSTTGTAPPVSYFEVGETVIFPSTNTYTRSNYALASGTGWNLSGQPMSLPSTYTMPSNDLTLNLIWEAIAYTITYMANISVIQSIDDTTLTVVKTFPKSDANPNPTVTIANYGSGIGEINYTSSAVPPSGKSFVRWSTDYRANRGTIYTPGQIITWDALSAQSLTLYLKWGYVITWNPNITGQATFSNTFEVGQTVSFPSTSSYKKTAFAIASGTGWNTYGQTTSLLSTYTMPSTNTSLYLIWSDMYDGKILNVFVENGGSGYTTPTLTASIGVDAVLNATVIGGAITDVTVVNGGSGYSSSSVITITGTGSGAAFTIIVGNSNTLKFSDLRNRFSANTSNLKAYYDGGTAGVPSGTTSIPNNQPLNMIAFKGK
jgi:hypothetical protein